MAQKINTWSFRPPVRHHHTGPLCAMASQVWHN